MPIPKTFGLKIGITHERLNGFTGNCYQNDRDIETYPAVKSARYLGHLPRSYGHLSSAGNHKLDPEVGEGVERRPPNLVARVILRR